MSNAQPYKPTPVKPTLDEFIDNAVANNEIEGYVMTAEQREAWRAQMREKYRPQWEKLVAQQAPSTTVE